MDTTQPGVPMSGPFPWSLVVLLGGAVFLYWLTRSKEPEGA